ncbi:GYD domain-containing protein [Halostella sp. JP-L12]|uniref:GYD domain-containing protein n=1 Tax=Halostella TaxID=1843185 RepID=UPI000EF7C84C|nr:MULTISPECIES: GYD domain-containing protein [Halostella]NHN46321.1 GYD domain-containing protein [Halostella sp. JP-L12]
MPTYIAFHEHRKEGAQSIKQLPERLEQAKEIANSMDCDVEYYLTNGRYDSVVVVDAPDERTAKQLALGVTSAGTVSTEFQRAFRESEVEELTEGVPEA